MEFLSDKRKEWLQNRSSQLSQSPVGSIASANLDTLALLYEARVLRKALQMACVHMADEIDNYDSARCFVAGNEMEACIEAARRGEEV